MQPLKLLVIYNYYFDHQVFLKKVEFFSRSYCIQDFKQADQKKQVT